MEEILPTQLGAKLALAPTQSRKLPSFPRALSFGILCTTKRARAKARSRVLWFPTTDRQIEEIALFMHGELGELSIPALGDRD